MNRPGCFDCVRKHCMQAYVLLEEAQQGYPDHRWLAVGHLAEASAECLSAAPELAHELRMLRLTIEGCDLHDLPGIVPTVYEILSKVVESERVCAATAQQEGSV